MKKVSEKAWGKYKAKQASVRKRARREVVDYVLDEGEDVTLGSAVSVTLLAAQKWGKSAAAIAAIWYDQAARGEGATVPKAMVYNNVNARRVRAIERDAAARYLEKGDVESFARACGVAAVGEVKRAASDTMLRNAARDGAEFAWVPGGSETCAFCMALSSRGWQRASKEVIAGDHADHIHDNCECEFAIRFDASTEIAGYEPEKYREMYHDAEGRNSNDKVNSMRRKLYAERKDEINERRRELYAERKAAEARVGEE